MVTISDLKYQVTLYKPAITTNNEGGKERDFEVEDMTYGKVVRIDQTRALQNGADALVDTEKITMRYTPLRSGITKDWEVEYMGKRANIIEITHEGLQNREWITLTVKDRVSGGIDPLVGGSVENWTDATFDEVTGDIQVTGSVPGGYLTEMTYNEYPDTGFSYINAEGSAPSTGPSADGHFVETGFTPGQVLLKWRKITSLGVPVTDWVEKVLTVTKLTRRNYRLKYNVSGTYFNLAPGFTSVEAYNIDGASMGVFTTIEDLILAWNADPVNEKFPIIDFGTSSGWLYVTIDPDPLEPIYPFQFILVS